MLVLLLIAVYNYLSFVEAAAAAACPRGHWMLSTELNACYMAMPLVTSQQGFTYTAANQTCTEVGGTPVSIRSRKEMQFVDDLVGTSAYWIGLRKIPGNQYVWEDIKTPVTFTNWRPSQPDNCCPTGQATCTLVNYASFNGQWEDAGCNKQWRDRITVVCKRAPLLCPADQSWKISGDLEACYMAMPIVTTEQGYTYAVAKRQCTEVGGTPVSIRSKAETQFVNDLVDDASYWIGLKKTGPNPNDFAWDDETPFNYTNWRDTEPDNRHPVGGATCTLANHSGSIGEWDDIGCNKQWRNRITTVCKRQTV